MVLVCGDGKEAIRQIGPECDGEIVEMNVPVMEIDATPEDNIK